MDRESADSWDVARRKRYRRQCVSAGRALQSAREQAGVSQEDLAARSGVALSAVRKFGLSGSVKLVDMVMCCEALGHDWRRLFDEGGSAPREYEALL